MQLIRYCLRAGALFVVPLNAMAIQSGPGGGDGDGTTLICLAKGAPPESKRRATANNFQRHCSEIPTPKKYQTIKQDKTKNWELNCHLQLEGEIEIELYLHFVLKIRQIGASSEIKINWNVAPMGGGAGLVGWTLIRYLWRKYYRSSCSEQTLFWENYYVGEGQNMSFIKPELSDIYALWQERTITGRQTLGPAKFPFDSWHIFFRFRFSYMTIWYFHIS